MTGISLNLHPVVPLLLAALAMPALGASGRRLVALAGSVLALLLLVSLPVGLSQSMSVLDFDLNILRVESLGRVFALAFALYAVIATVFAWTDTGAGPKALSLLLAAGGLGVTLAGDWLTLFLFWELLTISSLFIIWQGESRASFGAGIRYVLLHLAGGTCLLTGILLQWSATGSLQVDVVALQGLGPWLMIIGMLTNAAAPPLHAWLPDAYPRASIFGTVFLCAFTTKSAVYVLARTFPGVELLMWLGAAMTLYGVTFAVLANDMRRLLSYHIMSQVGYMVCAVGLGTALSLNGAAAHAFAHIFYKGLLMMSAGAVVYAVGTGRLSDLGGLARPLRLVMLLMLVGAFSIAGVPLFNGFVSKALVISAAAYENRPAIELILLVASMGTFLSVGLKMPWLAFGPRAEAGGPRVSRAVPFSMYLAMGVTALICLVTGLFPGLIYAQLPFAMKYAPYTGDHVVGSLQLLAGTALGFWLIRGLLARASKHTLDIDHLYREPVRRGINAAGRLFEYGGGVAGTLLTGILRTGDGLRTAYKGRALSTSVQAFLVGTSLTVLALILWVSTR
jgi:multicomponent Na+:H+ antiporter subunit D